MRQPTVGAAIIARNEERFLAGCLESLRGLVEDIVVVDTGSTDTTPAIATAFGARLFEFTWCNDFAAARNKALDEARADWILYIDADERVKTPFARPIGSFLDLETDAGAYVRFSPRLGYTYFNEPRLFLKHHEIRFKGRIHESHLPDLHAYAAQHNLSIPKTPIEIEHLGYEGDQAHKHARNLPLLEEELARNPQRLYCWHHLAETLAALGRTDEALETCRRGLAITVDESSPKAVFDRRQLAQTYARLLIDTGEDAGPLLTSLLREAPEDWSILYLKARFDLCRGDHGSARAISERLKSVDPENLGGGSVAYDKRLFRDLAWDLSAAAHLQAAAYSKAAFDYRKAAELAPEIAAYRVKAAALSARV